MDEQKILDTFGFNFKMYRTKLKMSQDDVASYISNVENGKHNLSLVNALIFSKLVGKTLDEMLREID